MTIVGGGICGILAAKMCGDRRWPYVVVERSEELGGVWNTLANTHSYLQASGSGGGERGRRHCPAPAAGTDVTAGCPLRSPPLLQPQPTDHLWASIESCRLTSPTTAGTTSTASIRMS